MYIRRHNQEWPQPYQRVHCRKMNAKTRILSEINQIHKLTYHMISEKAEIKIKNKIKGNRKLEDGYFANGRETEEIKIELKCVICNNVQFPRGM